MDKAARLSRNADSALVISWTFWVLLDSARLPVMRLSRLR